MYNKIQLGKLGEQIAADWLKNKGYKIIAKNFYCREGEIDLICEKNKVLHFIEVKARTNQSFGWPEDAVDEEKIDKIASSAQKYFEEKNIYPEWQIDIISIILNEKKELTEIKHLANA